MREEKIINNLGLIYKVMKDLHCKTKNQEDFDEVFYYGLIGLIKGIDSQENDKSTYLYICIRNSISQLFTRRTMQKRQGFEVQLEDIEEKIPSEINIEEEVILKDDIRRMLEALEKHKYKNLIKENFGIGCEKKSIQEISKEYGISFQAVSKKRIAVLKWLKKELENVHSNHKN